MTAGIFLPFLIGGPNCWRDLRVPLLRDVGMLAVSTILIAGEVSTSQRRDRTARLRRKMETDLGLTAGWASRRYHGFVTGTAYCYPGGGHRIELLNVLLTLFSPPCIVVRPVSNIKLTEQRRDRIGLAADE